MKPINQETPIFEIEISIGKYNNVKLEVEYSGGENENELDFECVRVSKDNNFSSSELEEIEELIESGYYEDITSYLETQYENSSFKFNPNH